MIHVSVPYERFVSLIHEFVFIVLCLLFFFFLFFYFQLTQQTNHHWSIFILLSLIVSLNITAFVF